MWYLLRESEGRWSIDVGEFLSQEGREPWKKWSHRNPPSSYKPIQFVDTAADWGAQENPRKKKVKGADLWSNFGGLQIKLALVRAPNFKKDSTFQITGSGDIFDFMGPALVDDPNEAFYVVVMDSQNFVTGIHEAARGGTAAVEIHPVSIVRAVLTAGVDQFIVVHNHPSGDPDPSQDDRALTKAIEEAAELLGLTFIDHIVIGHDGYVSFQERGLM